MLVGSKKENKKKRKVKKKSYTEEKILHAIKAVENGAPVKKTAAVYGIPASTLFRKVKNPDEVKKKSGPPTVLPLKVELDIAHWIILRAQTGAPVSKAELLDGVAKYVKELNLKTPFTNGRPNKHWYQGFRKRHPKVTLRKPQKLSYTRANITREDLQEWFADTQEYLRS